MYVRVRFRTLFSVLQYYYYCLGFTTDSQCAHRWKFTFLLGSSSCNRTSVWHTCLLRNYRPGTWHTAHSTLTIICPILDKYAKTRNTGEATCLEAEKWQNPCLCSPQSWCPCHYAIHPSSTGDDRGNSGYFSYKVTFLGTRNTYKWGFSIKKERKKEKGRKEKREKNRKKPQSSLDAHPILVPSSSNKNNTYI